MPHFNVVTYPAGEHEDAPSLVDWIDPGFATGYEEDPANVCPTALGRYGHQALCRARDGRWLFNAWTEQEDSDTWEGGRERRTARGQGGLCVLPGGTATARPGSSLDAASTQTRRTGEEAVLLVCAMR